MQRQVRGRTGMSRNVDESAAKPKWNAWVEPKKSYDGIWKQFQLYCENSSLNGCKYFTENKRHWIERTIWILVYFATIGGMVFVVLDVYDEFRMSPIVTFQTKHSYPVTKLPFPGEYTSLALCTLNRISFKSARNLAEEIYSSNVSSASYDEILDSLKYLGHLYDHSYSGYTAYKSQHKLLHKLLTRFYDGNYDTNEIMKNLTPNCSDVILKCSYASKEVSCSDIFTFRKTQDGYCCTFNYVRPRDEFVPVDGMENNKITNHGQSLYSKGPGILHGLSILIEPLLHDYFYTKSWSRGWKIMVFRPDIYPDNLAGGTVEQTIAPSTETYMKLDAVVFSTPQELKAYPAEQRKCIFRSLLPDADEISFRYTYADCIVNCRLEDIWRTCKCIPFVYEKKNDRRVCDLSDISCLGYNKQKWWMPFQTDDPEDELEDSDEADADGSTTEKNHPALDCSECLPQCNDVRYFVRNSVTSLTSGIAATNLAFNVSITEQSIVHVYFGSHGVTRLKQDVLYYWYELLSNIGGICGVFVGFSIVSILELLFFVVSPFLRCSNGIEKREPIVIQPRGEQRHSPFEVELYWAELGPRRMRTIMVDEKFEKKKKTLIFPAHNRKIVSQIEETLFL